MRINSSSLVSSQVPEFVRSDYPTFVAFVEAYYEYLDQQGVDLKAVRDLDQTIDSFIDYFKKELAVNLPKGLQVDERFLLQHIKDQYLAKGSSGSFKLLFRLLYNKNVSLSYPGTQMLRASDGKWEQDVSIFVNVLIGTPDLIDGKLVDVIKPDRVFKVLIDRRQYVEVEIDRIVQLSDTTYEFFIDRITPKHRLYDTISAFFFNNSRFSRFIIIFFIKSIVSCIFFIPDDFIKHFKFEFINTP